MKLESDDFYPSITLVNSSCLLYLNINTSEELVMVSSVSSNKSSAIADVLKQEQQRQNQLRDQQEQQKRIEQQRIEQQQTQTRTTDERRGQNIDTQV